MNKTRLKPQYPDISLEVCAQTVTCDTKACITFRVCDTTCSHLSTGAGPKLPCVLRIDFAHRNLFCNKASYSKTHLHVSKQRSNLHAQAPAEWPWRQSVHKGYRHGADPQPRLGTLQPRSPSGRDGAPKGHLRNHPQRHVCQWKAAQCPVNTLLC